MFSRFGGIGDESLKKRIAHGERIGALLAQHRFSPLRTIDQIALLAALEAGVLDSVPLETIHEVKDLLPGIIDSEPALAAFRADPAQLTDAVRDSLVDCVRQAATKTGEQSTGDQA